MEEIPDRLPVDVRPARPHQRPRRRRHQPRRQPLRQIQPPLKIPHLVFLPEFVSLREVDDPNAGGDRQHQQQYPQSPTPRRSSFADGFISRRYLHVGGHPL